VVRCALIALAWPSLGALPWVAVELAPHQHPVAQGEENAPNGSLPQGHRHQDASDIPGSPTHPADHDCAQCQVLKHLSRCALVLPQVPVVALPARGPVRPVARAESQYDLHQIAALPPVRGPPFFLG